MRDYTIAVIPGDGIGNEVVPEAVRVLDAAGDDHRLVQAEVRAVSRGAASTT